MRISCKITFGVPLLCSLLRVLATGIDLRVSLRGWYRTLCFVVPESMCAKSKFRCFPINIKPVRPSMSADLFILALSAFEFDTSRGRWRGPTPRTWTRNISEKNIFHQDRIIMPADFTVLVVIVDASLKMMLVCCSPASSCTCLMVVVFPIQEIQRSNAWSKVRYCPENWGEEQKANIRTSVDSAD